VSTRATGTFTIDSWDAQPYDERDGAKLFRTRVTKTFQGEFEGRSTAELRMARAEHDSAYVGFERIEGRLHGRAGTFVLHHTASSSRGARSASWRIVPDSGTGELLGVRGEAVIGDGPDGGHTFTLDYDLG